MSFPKGMDWESFSEEYYENIYDEEWPFVFENLGRRAYKAMYRAARKIGMNPEQAKTFCTSKFARHSEDEIDEAFYKAMLPLVKKYNQHLLEDKDFSTWNDSSLGAIGKKLGRRLGIVWKFDEYNYHKYVEPLWELQEEPDKHGYYLIDSDKPINRPVDGYGDIWTDWGKRYTPYKQDEEEGEEGTSKAKYGVVALIGAIVGALFTKAS